MAINCCLLDCLHITQNLVQPVVASPFRPSNIDNTMRFPRLPCTAWFNSLGFKHETEEYRIIDVISDRRGDRSRQEDQPESQAAEHTVRRALRRTDQQLSATLWLCSGGSARLAHPTVAYTGVSSARTTPKRTSTIIRQTNQ